MKRKILGGLKDSCPHCAGTMLYIHIAGIGVVSSCRECGCTVNGRVKDEVVIYLFDKEGES